jgi:hypothetical protein
MDGGAFARVLEMYAAARISKSKQYASLVQGLGTTIRGQVVSLSSDTNNTEGNIQSFTLAMKLTEVQEGKASGGDPGSGQPVSDNDI